MFLNDRLLTAGGVLSPFRATDDIIRELFYTLEINLGPNDLFFFFSRASRVVIFPGLLLSRDSWSVLELTVHFKSASTSAASRQSGGDGGQALPLEVKTFTFGAVVWHRCWV